MAPPVAGGAAAASNLGDLFSLSGGAGLTGGYVEPKSVREKSYVKDCSVIRTKKQKVRGTSQQKILTCPAKRLCLSET